MPFKYIRLPSKWSELQIQSNNFYIQIPISPLLQTVIICRHHHFQSMEGLSSRTRRSLSRSLWGIFFSTLKENQKKMSFSLLNAIIYVLFTYWMYITHWHLPFFLALPSFCWKKKFLFTFLTIFTSLLPRHSSVQTHSSFSHHLISDFYVPSSLSLLHPFHIS